MNCIRVGIVFEAFYQKFVEPAKWKAPRWASELNELRGKAALTPAQLWAMLTRSWAWGTRFYNSNHGKGACYDMLHLLFEEARVVCRREQYDMDKEWAQRLGRCLYYDVSRDPKLRKPEVEAEAKEVVVSTP